MPAVPFCWGHASRRTRRQCGLALVKQWARRTLSNVVQDGRKKGAKPPVSQDAGAACPLKRRVRWAEKRDEIPPCIFRKTGYNIKVCQRSRRWGRRRTSTLQRAGAWCKSGREEPHADHPGVRRPEISQGCPGAPDTEPQEDSCTEGTAWLSTWVVPRI